MTPHHLAVADAVIDGIVTVCREAAADGKSREQIAATGQAALAYFVTQEGDSGALDYVAAIASTAILRLSEATP